MNQAIEILCANTNKLLVATGEAIDSSVNILLKPRVLEMVITSRRTSTNLLSLLLDISEAEEFLLPVRLYLFLLEELDNGTMHDHDGLKIIVQGLGIIPFHANDIGVQSSIYLKVEIQTMLCTCWYYLLESSF